MGNATTSYIHFEISRPLYQDIKYYPRRFFFSIWTFLLFSKWISIIQDHFQKQDGKFCFLYCALYSTVITVRSTNKKLIALYYYYGQTVRAEFVCLFVFLDDFFWLLVRVGYNVSSGNKYTKCSSVLLLRLVYLFSERTLSSQVML